MNIRSTRLVIGMEVHVELATRTKMFSPSPNVAHPDFYDTGPNTLVDPVVAALPGALPVMNREAIEMSIRVGLALGCSIATRSRWDRKNYFYPDLPKGYQISQYDLPLCFDGAFDLPLPDGSVSRIGIIRAHLEEDAGKLSHELPGGLPYDGTLIDLNRAGTPLLEIVTEPDFTSGEECVAFARELRAICRALGVSEGDMQRGHMRFEPNINIIITTEDGREFTTPIVEVKNLNSFRSLAGAIEHEHRRQIEQWREDGAVHESGAKSTRGWDDVRGVTLLQRAKEEAHDYRYFPEPDLVHLDIDRSLVERLRAAMPQLPHERRERYVDEYGIDPKDAHALTQERAESEFFEACLGATAAGHERPAAARACAKLLLNLGAKRANERGVLISELGITPHQVAQVVALRAAGTIGSSAADQLFEILCERDDDALAVAREAGLVQVQDESQLEAWVDAAIEAEPQSAQDFRAGKQAAVGRLIGHIMKLSQGRADVQAARRLLQDRLK